MDPIADQRHPGRPEIGPQVKVSLPQEAIDKIDRLVAKAATSRSEWIRQLVLATLAQIDERTIPELARAALADDEAAEQELHRRDGEAARRDAAWRIAASDAAKEPGWSPWNTCLEADPDTARLHGEYQSYLTALAQRA